MPCSRHVITCYMLCHNHIFKSSYLLTVWFQIQTCRIQTLNQGQNSTNHYSIDKNECTGDNWYAPMLYRENIKKGNLVLRFTVGDDCGVWSFKQSCTVTSPTTATVCTPPWAPIAAPYRDVSRQTYFLIPLYTVDVVSIQTYKYKQNRMKNTTTTTSLGC